MERDSKTTARRRASNGTANAPRRRQTATRDPETGEKGLTPAQERFAALLATGESQSAAYRAAFPHSRAWKPQTVHARASELAATGKVQGRVSELRAKAAAEHQVEVSDVLRHYLLRLRADPRELVEYRVSACRYCHGKGGRYQFTNGELELAREKHEAKREKATAAGLDDPGDFDAKGGDGYSRLSKPKPDCPECAGDGVGRVVIKDTAGLSESALAIYAGMKEGKDGVEVKLASRDDALLQIARYVGFFEADHALDVKVAVDTAALDAIYAAAMQRAKDAEAVAKARGKAMADRASGKNGAPT